MPANYNFTIKGMLDDTEIRDTCTKWETRIGWLNDKLAAFVAKAKRSIRQTMSAVSGTIGAIQSVFGMLPAAVNPIFTAILTTITTTITSLHAIAAAYAAGGITAWATGIVEAAAIGLSIIGIAGLIMGQNQTNDALNRVSATLRSIGAAGNQWNAAIGAWTG